MCRLFRENLFWGAPRIHVAKTYATRFPSHNRLDKVYDMDRGDKPPTRDPWYEPLEDLTSIDHAGHWALNRSGLFLNTMGDIRRLLKVLDAASRFQAGPTAEQVKGDLTSQQITPPFS